MLGVWHAVSLSLLLPTRLDIQEPDMGLFQIDTRLSRAGLSPRVRVLDTKARFIRGLRSDAHSAGRCTLQMCLNDDQKQKTALQSIGDAIFVAWSVLIQIAGGVVSLGLLLNLCGYGYRINLNPPKLEISTLPEMRRENAEQRYLQEGGECQQLFPE